MANSILALRAFRRQPGDQTDKAEVGQDSFQLSVLPFADDIRRFLDEKAGSALAHHCFYDGRPNQSHAAYVTVTGPGETCLVVLGDVTREQADAIEARLTDQSDHPAGDMAKMTSLPVFQQCVADVLGNWINAKWYRMQYW